MFKQLIKLLEDIQEINWESHTPTNTYLELKGNSQEVIDKANKLELIDFSGYKGKVDFELTEKGYNLLQKEINTRLSKEVLNHTKIMKKLTFVMLIITIINLGLFLYQILK